MTRSAGARWPLSARTTSSISGHRARFEPLRPRPQHRGQQADARPSLCGVGDERTIPLGGPVEVLQHRLRKMLMEERYHFLHGRSWLRSGIDSAPLNRAWQEAIEWFGRPDGDTATLHRQGKLSMGPGELRARLEEQLETKATHADIDWKQWDGVRRRGGQGAIDAQTFGMLRGLEEKKYAPPTAKPTPL